MSESNNKQILEFLELVGKLKHIKRTGWIRLNLDDCETISGHMYRMAMMTFLLKEENNIDRSRCLQIALVHDLAESIVGDITPFCGITVEEKHQKEDDAMKRIAGLIGSCGDNVYNLYKEYENNSTPEAKFVKELDKFDLLLQAFEYEKRENTPLRFQEFFDNTNTNFQHPLVRNLYNEISLERDAFNKNTNNLVDS